MTGAAGGDTWDPAQYAAFQGARARPFWDLVAMVEAVPGMAVVDLGCGDGGLTRAMHERLGAGRTLGVDSSAAMLGRAHGGGGVDFVLGDIADFPGNVGGGWDLVFANAALHWVDDHPALLARLRDGLAPAGQLAFQVPANHDHPSHLVADEVAGEPPFAAALAGWRRGVPVLDARAYDELLHRLGFPRRRVELRIYGEEMASVDGVVEWVKGSLLTPFARRLGDLYPAFVDRYRARLGERLGEPRPYYYTYARIFAWAGLAAA